MGIDHAPKSSSIPVAPFATRQQQPRDGSHGLWAAVHSLLFWLPTEPASPSPAFTTQLTSYNTGNSHFSTWRCSRWLLAAAQDAYTALGPPFAHAGRILLLPMAWVPPLPHSPSAHLQSWAASFQLCQPFWEGLNLWAGMAVPPPPRSRLSVKSRVSEAWTRTAPLLLCLL